MRIEKVKIVLFCLLLVVFSRSVRAGDDGVNTLGSVNGFLVDFRYSLAPIPSMAPKPTPHSMVGAGLGFISNRTFILGVRGAMTVPSSGYTDGLTLDFDTINIEYSTWDVKLEAAYLFELDGVGATVSPSLGAGYGRSKVHRVDYHGHERRVLLEHANIVAIEPGVSFNYVVDKSFVVSLGISYQFNVPDRLMINYSSKDLNMFKVNVGIAFGFSGEQGGRGGGWRR